MIKYVKTSAKKRGQSPLRKLCLLAGRPAAFAAPALPGYARFKKAAPPLPAVDARSINEEAEAGFIPA